MGFPINIEQNCNGLSHTYWTYFATRASKDAYKWTPEQQLNYLDKMNVDNFISSEEEGYGHDPNFIPSNERGIIKNPNYFARKVTMATELAIEDHQQHNQQYEYVDPIMQRYRQAKAEGYKSPLGLHSQYYHDKITKAEEYKKKGYYQGKFFKWIK